ncbi:lymphatic vessel endothelial hyaluronic acid receptor 1-like [Acipenser ruthenus]|uniref:lymphatic vessel endothelial hyaluronic acid receptor 1-like n=1 Tax=Acipenser ruthenus TaxID=7906 RepID=UPI00155FF161|nr:lymphatic vessel endothelial hyaluronic acid receptor 1-like [Acipenser ruthenus]
MAKVWLIVFLFFALVILVLLQNPINIKDLVVSTNCRISGVLLVSLGKDYKLNATNAKFACQSLGITLATKEHVKRASEHGLETCRFGWTVENVVVVSRIKPLPNCGKNKTGVIDWHVKLEKLFDAYCFNSTDTMTNSCAPIMHTTAPPPMITTELREEKTSPTLKSPLATSTKLMVEASATPVTQSLRSQTIKAQPSSSQTTNAQPSSPQATNAQPSSSQTTNAQPSSPQATNAQYSSSQTTKAQSWSSLTTSTSDHTEPMDPNGNADTSVHSKGTQFGALQTALLVLAIVFLLTALTAGFCYLKQYKETLPIADSNQQKESIETELWKHNLVDENEQEQEQTEYQEQDENLKDSNGAKDIIVTAPHETNAQD